MSAGHTRASERFLLEQFRGAAGELTDALYCWMQFLHLEDADIAMDKFGHLKMVGKLIAQHTSKFDQTPVYDGDVVQAQRWRP
jgi:Mn-containing catalase